MLIFPSSTTGKPQTGSWLKITLLDRLVLLHFWQEIWWLPRSMLPHYSNINIMDPNRYQLNSSLSTNHRGLFLLEGMWSDSWYMNMIRALYNQETRKRLSCPWPADTWVCFKSGNAVKRNSRGLLVT